MKSYYELFDKEANESQCIDETFAKINNTKGLTEGIKYLKEIGATWLDIDNYFILYSLAEYTKNTVSNEEKIKLLDKISNQEDVIKISTNYDKTFKAQQVIITKEDYEIKVMKLSDVIPQSKELLIDLEDDRRVGTCYQKAYDISIHLGVPNDIVTGYMYGYTNKSRFLHSWVETKLKKDGEEVVIDGTLNAIINKEGYYKLRHIKPLTRISNKTLKSDIKNYLYGFQNISPEVYYLFRDEIISDLDKNKNSFKNK